MTSGALAAASVFRSTCTTRCRLELGVCLLFFFLFDLVGHVRTSLHHLVSFFLFLIVRKLSQSSYRAVRYKRGKNTSASLPPVQFYKLESNSVNSSLREHFYKLEFLPTLNLNVQPSLYSHPRNLLIKNVGGPISIYLVFSISLQYQCGSHIWRPF